MSQTTYCKLTHKPRPKKKVRGDVPMPQLHKDIDAGWRFFMANRIERETLKGAPVRIR